MISFLWIYHLSVSPNVVIFAHFQVDHFSESAISVSVFFFVCMSACCIHLLYYQMLHLSPQEAFICYSTGDFQLSN